MKYIVNTDLTGDTTLAEAEAYIAEHGGMIRAIVRDSNGNFDTTVAFLTRQAAVDFIAQHEELTKEEYENGLAASRVSLDLDLDMAKWRPVPAIDLVSNLVVGFRDRPTDVISVIWTGEKAVFMDGDEPIGLAFASGDKLLSFVQKA